MTGQNEGPGATNAGALSKITAAQAALSSPTIIPRPRDPQGGEQQRPLLLPADVRNAAHEHAARGWSVLPLHGVNGQGTCSCTRRSQCPSAGKHPQATGWQNAPRMAGTDIEEHSGWSDAALRPEVGHYCDGIGIRTGTASGIVVLDEDIVGALEEFAEDIGLNDGWPATREHRSGSGGRHLIYAITDNDPWPSTKRQGLDILADGKQVVTAPTISAKGPYAVTDDRDPVPVPQELRDYMRRDRRPQVQLRPDDESVAPGDPRLAAEEQRHIQRALARLGQLARPWQKGAGWEQTTFEVCCNLFDLADSTWTTLTRDQAADLVRVHAPTDESWDASQVELKLASAAKTVSGEGWSAPALAKRLVSGVVATPSENGSEVVPTEGSAAEQLRAAYPLCQSKRVPLAEIFETDAKGRISPNLLVETSAKYINHEFALGGDGRLHSYDRGVYVAKDDEIKRRVAWLLGEKYSPNRYRAIADVVSVQPHPVIPDVPDQQFINARNGMVEVASGKLLDHDPEYLSTVQLPVDYTPGATCPRFDAWVAQVIPADTVEMFWEMLGYLLLPGNPLQVAVLLHGPGGNGKGTLLRALDHLLGRQNVSAVTLQEMTEGKFEVAAMYGKLANRAGDIDPQYLKKTAMFKAITGGDVINAQHKNQKPFEFTCWAVPVFSANELWRSADVSRGYFRRWVPLPFPNPVRDSNAPFSEQALFDETAGILAKALPALGNLLRRGRFELSPSSQALLANFEQQADSVLSWLAEDDQVLTSDVTKTEIRCPRAKLHKRFSAWCTESGHVSLSSTKLYARLEVLGYHQATVQGERSFRGLALGPSWR